MMITNLVVLSPAAISLNVVADDIVKAANTKGFQCTKINKLLTPFKIIEDYDSCILVSTFTPALSKAWMLLARDLNKEGFPSIYYVTADGEPAHHLVQQWMVDDIVYVANSEATSEFLRTVGVRVKDIVYHGVDTKLAKESSSSRDAIRKYLIKKFIPNASSDPKDFVVFGTISSSRPRKGLDIYCEVVRRVVEMDENVGFYIYTDEFGGAAFEGIPRVITDTRYGTLSGSHFRNEIFKLLSGFTFYVQPSLSEGFCLPVLESLAVGVPVIHMDYKPLTEITNEKTSIRVPYVDILKSDFQDGVFYILHLYELDSFVEAIIHAIDLYRNSRDQYTEMSNKAFERAKLFDIHRVYAKLFKMLSSMKVR